MNLRTEIREGQPHVICLYFIPSISSSDTLSELGDQYETLELPEPFMHLNEKVEVKESSRNHNNSCP